ncbi:hypothetical protein ACN28I_43300 [Archangium gephyra]
MSPPLVLLAATFPPGADRVNDQFRPMNKDANYQVDVRFVPAP